MMMSDNNNKTIILRPRRRGRRGVTSTHGIYLIRLLPVRMTTRLIYYRFNCLVERNRNILTGNRYNVAWVHVRVPKTAVGLLYYYLLRTVDRPLHSVVQRYT